MTNIDTPLDAIETLSALGMRVAVARKALRWRQQDLCDRACISRSTLVAIEKGSPNVSMDAWVRSLWALNALADLEKILPLETEMQQLLAYHAPQRVRLK